MLRESFDRELEQLRTQVLALGNQVEQNLVKVTEALLKRDKIMSQRLIDVDREVNEKRIGIVLDSLKLIATQQPMARDMRFIAAVIEIAGELERMHDYVKGIGKTSMELDNRPLLPSFAENMPMMAKITRDMLRQALDAFAAKDPVLARSVPPLDNLVDELFLKLYGDLVASVVAGEETVARANQIEWTIHNMERSADRVINVCEWVVYMATGEYKEFDSEYEAAPRLPSSEERRGQ